VTGSVITFSAGSDSGSVALAFALAKSAAISSALSWRFGSLFVVSATASSATGLGSTTGSGSGASMTGSDYRNRLWLSYRGFLYDRFRYRLHGRC
jgi:hypothetical protein